MFTKEEKQFIASLCCEIHEHFTKLDNGFDWPDVVEYLLKEGYIKMYNNDPKIFEEAKEHSAFVEAIENLLEAAKIAQKYVECMHKTIKDATGKDENIISEDLKIVNDAIEKFEKSF